MNEYLNEGFDYVITVCDHAAAHCPVFVGHPERSRRATHKTKQANHPERRRHPGRSRETRPERRRGKNTQRVHWPIDDPVGTKGTEEQIMTAFRKTRDLIGELVGHWLRR